MKPWKTSSATNETRKARPFFALIRNGLAMGQYYHRARRENRKPALTSRQEARERRIVGSLKPFRWNPAGNQSRPVELDQQPEASLAWWVGNRPCEA